MTQKKPTGAIADVYVFLSAAYPSEYERAVASVCIAMSICARAHMSDAAIQTMVETFLKENRADYLRSLN